MKNSTMTQMIAFGATAFALFVASLPTLAEETTKSDTHDGKFVSMAGDSFVMTSTDDQKHTHTLAKDAKVTLDGAASTAKALKSGMMIRVTTEAIHPKIATRVEAIEKDQTFAKVSIQKPNTHDGKLVSMTKDEFVMSNADGKEHQHTVTEQAKVTCDGKACKLSDLKAGMKIRVTTKASDLKAATKIEALDKNVDFAK